MRNKRAKRNSELSHGGSNNHRSRRALRRQGITGEHRLPSTIKPITKTSQFLNRTTILNRRS